MFRVPINRIRPGMILARPIVDPLCPGVAILERNRELSGDAISRLATLGVREVWIRNRDVEFLEDLIDAELGQRQRELCAQVGRSFRRVTEGTAVELDVEHFETSIRDLFAFLAKHQQSNFLLEKLDAFDNYLFAHSANVCYLALLLALGLNRHPAAGSALSAQESSLLGLGCLLHDIGKTFVPRQILDKPTELTKAEMAEIRRHTVYGHQLVRGRIPPAAAEVVLHHHQRWDGQGYPARLDTATAAKLPPLSGDDIPRLARLAALADMYDAATSQRCYSGSKLPVQALFEMRTQCGGVFEPALAEVFYRSVPPYPLGQTVSLCDGSEAVVVDFNADTPYKPRVRTCRDPHGTEIAAARQEEIDLRRDGRQIVAVEGQNIQPYLPDLSGTTPVFPTPSNHA